MKIFDAKIVPEIDKYTIDNEPIASIDLMERAGKACVDWIVEKFDRNQKFAVFTGSGNNGGDGLVIARMLALKAYSVRVFLLNAAGDLKPDPLKNLMRLKEIQQVEIQELNSREFDFELKENEGVIDAIFGSGLSRPIEGFVSDVIKHLNVQNALKIAIDMPSGLFGEDNSILYDSSYAVFQADYTLTLQQPTLSFFFAENEKYIGEWQVLPIGLHPEIIENTPSSFYFLEDHDIKKWLKKRPKFAHKGNFGHALLLAGSYGMMGAAVLAAKAAIKSGLGLLTSHVPGDGNLIMQISVPESLVSIDPSDIIVSSFPCLSNYSAVAAGPGLRTKMNSRKMIRQLLSEIQLPLLLDADALNAISMEPDLLSLLPENTIITPHPKEFDRLFGASENAFQRLQKQIDCSFKYKIYIVLKGAHTSVSCPDGMVYFNSTGNPGLASGGSGDVLSGIILSLLAQAYSPKEAALIGVFIHGLAADCYVGENGQESLSASDLINYLGKAFKKLDKTF